MLVLQGSFKPLISPPLTRLPLERAWFHAGDRKLFRSPHPHPLLSTSPTPIPWLQHRSVRDRMLVLEGSHAEMVLMGRQRRPAAYDTRDAELKALYADMDQVWKVWRHGGVGKCGRECGKVWGRGVPRGVRWTGSLLRGPFQRLGLPCVLNSILTCVVSHALLPSLS